MRLFKRKQQVEQVKSLPLIDASKTVTKHLSISKVQITYCISYVKPYQAVIEFAENPTEWNNQGITESKTIIGDNWYDLIDKVRLELENDDDGQPKI